MARRTEKSEVGLRSWDDVDAALKKIGECEIGIEALEADMNMKINDAKAEAEKLGRPMKNAIEVLAGQIKDFVADNRDGLVGKSRDLCFGSVGYRQSTSISYSTKKTEQVLESIKKYGMLNCINVKETVNKEVLKLYSDKELQKVGAKRKVEDRFFCEADREKLKG